MYFSSNSTGVIPDTLLQVGAFSDRHLAMIYNRVKSDASVLWRIICDVYTQIESQNVPGLLHLEWVLLQDIWIYKR